MSCLVAELQSIVQTRCLQVFLPASYQRQKQAHKLRVQSQRRRAQDNQALGRAVEDDENDDEPGPLRVVLQTKHGELLYGADSLGDAFGSGMVYMAQVMKDASFKLQLTGIVSWRSDDAMRTALMSPAGHASQQQQRGGGGGGAAGGGVTEAEQLVTSRHVSSHQAHMQLSQLVYSYAPHMTLAGAGSGCGGTLADFRPIVTMNIAASGNSGSLGGRGGGASVTIGAGDNDDVEVRILVSLPLALAILANVRLCTRALAGGPGSKRGRTSSSGGYSPGPGAAAALAAAALMSTGTPAAVAVQAPPGSRVDSHAVGIILISSVVAASGGGGAGEDGRAGVAASGLSGGGIGQQRSWSMVFEDSDTCDLCLQLLGHSSAHTLQQQSITNRNIDGAGFGVAPEEEEQAHEEGARQRSGSHIGRRHSGENLRSAVRDTVRSAFMGNRHNPLSPQGRTRRLSDAPRESAGGGAAGASHAATSGGSYAGTGAAHGSDPTSNQEDGNGGDKTHPPLLRLLHHRLGLATSSSSSLLPKLMQADGATRANGCAGDTLCDLLAKFHAAE
jgi:hypothetical protein